MYQFSFAFPVDGVMLTEAAGKKVGDGLQINCIVNAEPGKTITVNGAACIAGNNDYHVPLLLKGGRNLVWAVDEETGSRTTMEVYYLKNAYKKYRFSLDDNIWFLQNIARHQNQYTSLFEDPYLALIKSMHDRYGTKFHLNIYYECPEFGGFRLTDMTDKFKLEWRYHADWLRLSFHASANLPDRPYIRATYRQMKYEHDRVAEQIIRFAGEDTFAGPVTTVHWGDATVEAVRALRAGGVRIFVGSFEYADPNNTPIRYYLNAGQCALLNIYGMYYDKQEDVAFVRYGAMMQHLDVNQIPKAFDAFESRHPLYAFRELCVHEQYFYPHYVRYIPDYVDRFDTAIRWCVDNGYEPSFLKEALEW